MRHYSKKFKKYILRCLENKIPNQERLVSIFLEGLLNKKLHAALFLMKHKTLAANIKDAIELDNNVNKTKIEEPQNWETWVVKKF